MADQSSQEKTEHATPRRLREARKKGQVPKSRDVSTVFVLVIVFAVLCFAMSYMGGELKQLFQLCFDTLQHSEITGAHLMDLGKASVITFAKVLAPLMLAGVVTGALAGLMQVGGIFATDPLKPKWEKINPIEGFKNMFKIVTLIELFKNLLKLLFVLYLAYTSIYKQLDAVLMSMKIDIMLSAKIAGGIIFEFIVKVCIAFVLVSLLDYAIQKWNFMKNMRMTKDEVKREYKQDEGDPAIKGERRRIHREMAFGDVKQAVKKSDVVVTNPAHVACGLQYNKEEMSAPQLTINGQEKFAEMILDIAKEENIPIVRNIPLAWSLLRLEMEEEIPEELYEAAAEVLAIVYEMKRAEENTGQNPPQYA